MEGSFEVNSDKLLGTVIERYFVDKSADAQGSVEEGGTVLVVEPVSMWNGLSANAPMLVINYWGLSSKGTSFLAFSTPNHATR